MSGTGCAPATVQHTPPAQTPIGLPEQPVDRRNEPSPAALHRRREQEADRAWFVFAAAHDLQSPLRSLHAALQTLASGYMGRLSPAGMEVLNRACENIGRMSHMVRDLLAYAKAGGYPEAPRQQVNLQEPLRAALENLASEMEESGADVSYEGLPEVWGDSGPLVQLFQNLVGNALKFRRREEPLHIEVRAVLLRGTWNISVSDNGQGFEPGYACRIFAPLRRLHGPDVPGTGLGLAICQRIVESHGGVIWAHSRPGQGSTFCFTLPSGSAPANSPATA